MDLENRLVGKCKQFDSATQLSIVPEFYLASKLLASRGAGRNSALNELKKLYKPHMVSSFDDLNILSVRSDPIRPNVDLENSDEEIDLVQLCGQKIRLFVRYICEEVVNYILYNRAGNLVSALRPPQSRERIPHFRRFFEGADSNPLVVLSKAFWQNFEEMTERPSAVHRSLASVFSEILFRSKTWLKTHAAKQARSFMARYHLQPDSAVWTQAMDSYIASLPQPTAFLTLYKQSVFLKGKFWSF